MIAQMDPHRRRRLRPARQVDLPWRCAVPCTSRFPPGLVFSHFGVAAAGLVVWIIHLINDQHALAWVAVALLVVVALLGFIMLVRWVPATAHAPR